MAVANRNRNLGVYPRDVVMKDELSLGALGLYISLLNGDIDLDIEDEDYRTAFYELWSKNYIEITIK
jgi:hypothetical protein